MKPEHVTFYNKSSHKLGLAGDFRSPSTLTLVLSTSKNLIRYSPGLTFGLITGLGKTVLSEERR